MAEKKYIDADHIFFAALTGTRTVEEIIEKAPAADVRPVKRGKWKKHYADHEAFGERPFFRYCSVCNAITVFPYNFCPNCGADMRKKEDHETADEA